MDVVHAARAVGAHGEPAARRQRPVDDRDGHRDALRRAGLRGGPASGRDVTSRAHPRAGARAAVRVASSSPYEEATLQFIPTRAEGLARLAQFVPRAGGRLCRDPQRGSRPRGPLERLDALPLHPPSAGHRARGARRRAGAARQGRGGEIRRGGALAHLLERLARAAPGDLGPLPRAARPRPEDARGGHLAAPPLRGGHRGPHRHRGLRRLGARAGRDRLPAQPRADVVLLDLDLHPAPALDARCGRVHAPPDRRRPGLEHALLALDRRPADAGQDLSRPRRQHRPLHRRALLAARPLAHRRASEREPPAAGRAARAPPIRPAPARWRFS